MKQNFKDQFINLREIIRTNVDTLKNLIHQADKLSELINSLTETHSNNELKEQLQANKNEIHESITVLVKQTDKLFDSYKKLVEEVFGKQ